MLWCRLPLRISFRFLGLFSRRVRSLRLMVRYCSWWVNLIRLLPLLFRLQVFVCFLFLVLRLVFRNFIQSSTVNLVVHASIGVFRSLIEIINFTFLTAPFTPRFLRILRAICWLLDAWNVLVQPLEAKLLDLATWLQVLLEFVNDSFQQIDHLIYLLQVKIIKLGWPEIFFFRVIGWTSIFF